jgi:hypothetical protein
MEIVGKEARRGVQGLKTKGSGVLMNEGMAKGNDKKTYTPEDISSKSSGLEDQLIDGLDDKYSDSVQKLIDWRAERTDVVSVLKNMLDRLDDQIEEHTRQRDFCFAALANETQSPARARVLSSVLLHTEIIHTLWVFPTVTTFARARCAIRKANSSSSRYPPMPARRLRWRYRCYGAPGWHSDL